MVFLLILVKKRGIKMPIVKCDCKECKFYDDRFYCCKDIVELKTYGQCVEGRQIELNKALELEEQRMAMDKAIVRQKTKLEKIIEEQSAAVFPYCCYNTYLGGKGI